MKFGGRAKNRERKNKKGVKKNCLRMSWWRVIDVMRNFLENH